MLGDLRKRTHERCLDEDLGAGLTDSTPAAAIDAKPVFPGLQRTCGLQMLARTAQRQPDGLAASIVPLDDGMSPSPVFEGLVLRCGATQIPRGTGGLRPPHNTANHRSMVGQVGPHVLRQRVAVAV